MRVMAVSSFALGGETLAECGARCNPQADNLLGHRRGASRGVNTLAGAPESAGSLPQVCYKRIRDRP